MAKKQIIYMHKVSGDIKICRTDLEGQLLGDDWTKILFIKNQDGVNVMRVKFGTFTMDILPNGTREVIDDGNGTAK
jgi:hypothetical protein